MSVKFNLIERANPNNPEGPKKWYAVPSSESPLTGKAMTRAATANTSTAAIEMEAAMEHLAAFIPQQLLQGHTVKVPGLGSFRISFKSKGTESVADFNASAMISEPRIMFTPDKALRNSVIPNLVFENGGLLKDGVRYATMADYLKATGDSGSAGTGSGDSNGDGGDSGNNGGATGGNPL